MDTLEKKIGQFAKWHEAVRNPAETGSRNSMPGNAYFIEENDILTIPRDDGDCRYPYGKDGFNFWAYTSGYMHGNEGLFSLFLRANEGQEPKIAFFAGFPDQKGGYIPIPLLSVPIQVHEGPGCKEAERYTVFSKSCVYYVTEAKGMRFVIRIFPDAERNLFFTIHVQNLEPAPKNFFISTFMNPFLRHNLTENGENRWYREVRYVKDTKGDGEPGAFVIKVNEDISRTVSVSNIGVLLRNISRLKNSRLLRQEATASRYQYVGGSRSSLHSPQSLYTGSFQKEKQVCAFTEVGAAGDILHLELGGAGSARYDMVFRYRVHYRDENAAEELLKGKVDPQEIDRKASELEQSEKQNSQGLHLEVFNAGEKMAEESIFNSFFQHLKTQVEFCSLIKGYIQLSAGSLIGIRDIFQALEGLLFWRPEAARQKMLEAFDYIFPDGRCPRQYSLPVSGETAPAMDLRPFIDQGVWVISTVSTYLKFTGDSAFLTEECGYYEMVDEKKGLVRKSTQRDTVLEHLFKIMEYLLSNRDFNHTGCICALYGDWNDALDGLGVSMDPGKEYGTGVSVMASLQVYQNLNEMMELLAWLDGRKYAARIEYYRDAREELGNNLRKYAVVRNDKGEERIVHGWGDQRSYIVGGFDDPDRASRIGLTSNAFWVLSRLYDSDQRMGSTILSAFKSLDSKYGFKTFEPYFPANTPGVGRIPKLPAGTAENGAVYIHASAFAAMALFRMGHAEAAWKQLYKLFPFTHEKISCSPYVMPNSYGWNEEKEIDGESMLDWQTGSSNVVLKTLIRYVVGLEPEFEGLWLQPANWTPFGGFSFCIRIKECKLRITYRNSGNGSRRYTVNGEERGGIYSEVMKVERLWIPEHELKCPQLEVVVED